VAGGTVIGLFKFNDRGTQMKSGVRSLLVLALLLGAAWQSELAWPAQNASARLAGVIRKWETFERREFPEEATLRGQHEAVLDDGPLPLDLLQQRIDVWIGRGKTGKVRSAGAAPKPKS
jgi:hypothetical protein